MSQCPSCFYALTEERADYACSTCTPTTDPRASAYAGTEVKKPTVTAGPLGAAVNCSSCGTPAQKEVCPACHYDLPGGWRQVVTTCIALAGPRASGKTVFIGVLRKQLELYATLMGGALTFDNQQTRIVFETEYDAALFGNGHLPNPTGSAVSGAAFQREPLILNLGVVNGQRHVLVMRDVAGEDLENQVANTAAFSFFRNADAVLFLFDPMMIPAISAQLAGIAPEPTNRGADPLLVLGNLIRLLRGEDEYSIEKVLTPLALIISKFDALHALSQVPGAQLGVVMNNAGAAFNRDRSLENVAYEEGDARFLDAEVRSLLELLGGAGLLNTVDAIFSNLRLFACSALGAPPSLGNDVSKRGITPFRILDPLKWALNRSGAIGLA